jgi:hypothetical protein
MSKQEEEDEKAKLNHTLYIKTTRKNQEEGDIN